MTIHSHPYDYQHPNPLLREDSGLENVISFDLFSNPLQSCNICKIGWKENELSIGHCDREQNHHVFHLACLIDHWVQNKKFICPSCNAQIRNPQTHLRNQLSLFSNQGNETKILAILNAFADYPPLDDIRLWAMGPAAKNGHVSILRILKDNIEISEPWAVGLLGAALCESAENGKQESIHELLTYGAPPPHLRDKAIRTAATNGHLSIIPILKNVHPEVLISTQEQGLSLRGASENGHKEVVQFFLAGTRISDNDKAIAKQLAHKNGHTEIVALLEPGYCTLS